MGAGNMKTEKIQKSSKRATNLEKAIAALQIKDVAFNSFSFDLLNDFDPNFDERADNLSYQTRVNLLAYDLVKEEYYRDEDTRQEESVLTEHTLKVSIELGVRLGEKGKLSKSADDPDVLVLLKGVIAAYYHVKDESIISNEDALEKFASTTSPYHVWPYWREHVSSTLSRANVKKITLPYMKTMTNKSTQTKPVKDK